jgi:receptor-type tyrosine-protein phosphatase Q
LLVSAQALYPSSLILSWEPPVQELRNGIIQQYTVMIIEQETGRVISRSIRDTRLNVTSLHPYYTYNCTIAAATFAGTGPFSPAVVIQLPETGMCFELLCSLK